MGEWRESLGRLRARWAALSLLARVVSLCVIATLATAGVVAYAYLSRPEMAMLYGGLDREDTARIVEQLRAEHVDYELGPDGTTIHVPSQDVHETRLRLATEGLPSGGGIGFEIFDTQRFGESEFVEQVQYLRALEGELSRTLSDLDGVESARVHLVLPERRLLGGQDERARASIVVAMAGGRQLRDDQVRGIVHLVAGSVRGLDPGQVTVLDGRGRRLSGGESGDGTEEAGDAETLRLRIERGRERALQELLDQTMGPGAAVVRVSAEVSFTREERLEERYDPESVATRSFEITSDGSQGTVPGTAGIAGAVSALPGGPGPEPTSTDSTEGRRTEVRNFEVTKLVRREVEPLGRVTRLSIAVVVDGRWEGTGDERHFVPRPDEELARLRAVVASAAGIREARGDSLTVECVPLVAPEAPADTTTEIAASPIPVTTWAGVVAGVLVLLVVLASWRARARRARAAAAAASSIIALPGPDVAQTQPSEAKTPSSESPVTGEDSDTVRARVIDFARRDPELAARVVRAWLASDHATADAAPLPATPSE